MKNVDIRFDMNSGWQKMSKAIDPAKFGAIMNRNVAKATQANARLMVKAIRAGMKSGRYEANAPLTIIIKHSAKPLIDSGELWRSVTHKVIDPYSVFVGVLRAAKSSDGRSLANIAEFLHEGGAITVTDKMRAMFEMLYKVSIGRLPESVLDGKALEMYTAARGEIIYPIGDATQVIRVKGRPYISDQFENGALLTTFQKNWQEAVEAVFKRT